MSAPIIPLQNGKDITWQIQISGILHIGLMEIL